MVQLHPRAAMSDRALSWGNTQARRQGPHDFQFHMVALDGDPFPDSPTLLTPSSAALHAFREREGCHRTDDSPLQTLTLSFTRFGGRCERGRSRPPTQFSGTFWVENWPGNQPDDFLDSRACQGSRSLGGA